MNVCAYSLDKTIGIFSDIKMISYGLWTDGCLFINIAAKGPKEAFVRKEKKGKNQA